MRIAIIGTGKITHNFIDAARKVEGIQLVAVFSRSQEKGAAYASEHGLSYVFTSMQDLASSSEVDAVYIASPNSCHSVQAIELLNAGKHVLCEKPIASNHTEASQMYEAAKENRVVLLEAMRPVFDPGFAKIKELLPRLGTIRRAQFAMNQYSSRYDNFKRGVIENAFNPALSNAALMDIGVYCLHPMVRLFGKPEKVVAESVFLENGMEGIGTALLRYPTMLGEIQYSKITNGTMPSQIQGEDALMLIDAIQHTKRIELIYRDGRREEFLIEKEENNMYYEAEEFARLVHENCVEHEYKESSLAEMEVMDEIRRVAGIEFVEVVK